MTTTLSILATNAAQLEGSSGSKAFTFTVNRTGNLSGVSSALWRVVGVGNTPANAADFLNEVLPSGTVSFAAGESSKIISVDVSGDVIVENDEGFSVILYSSTGATIGTSSAIGTIFSDDLPSVSLSLTQASVAEDGSNNLAYTFARTGSTAAPLTVNYIVRGKASLDDYASLPLGNIKSITFAAGASTTTLLVDPAADSLVETDEIVEISLSPTSFYTISTPAAVVGTIINDDTNLAITPASISQQEGNSGITQYTFTVTRTGLLSGSSSVQWSVAGIGGQPADANDFPGGVLPTGSVTFAAGETSQTITIEVNSDTIAENDETFSVTLSNPTGATITTATASGTIVNDDTNLAITPAIVSQKEGNIGGTIFNFTVIRTGVVTGTSTASWIVAGNGDHPVASDDFIGDAFPSGIVTFAAGETEQNIAIEVKGDSVSEASEGFRITLFNPSGATIATASSNGVVIDDDLPIVDLSLNQSAVNEDGNGNLVYVFTRTGPALDALIVYYTISGSADSNDYSGIPAGSPKSITFLAGESSVSLVVDPTADALAEADETVAITLSANGDYIRETTTAVIGTIVNDDTNLAITPASISQQEGNSGITQYTFTVTRTGLLSGSSSVQWSVAGFGGQPADANDFPGGVLPTGSVTFAAGETSQTITIEVNSDTIAENDETFAVTLANPTGATITTATASGTIVNDDTNLAIIPPTISQPEGNSGVTFYTFTVIRTGLLSGSSTAQWSVTGIGGQPADANDFPGGLLPTGSVTFEAGETTKTITIEVNGDAIAENDEAFAVTLADPIGATIATATASGTIVNDDTNLAITPSSISQPEDNSGVTQYTFTVTRAGILSGSSTTQWSVTGIGGLPADANDFPGGVLPTGSVTFATGETTKTITIEVNGDSIAENDETFSVTLANPTGATITTATASGTIVNDDTNLAITPSNISQPEGSSGATLYTFTVNRTGVVSGSSTAQWSVAGIGDHPANADDFGGSFPTGTVTFVAGETSQTITIEVSGDSIAENDETFAISLSGPSGATITTANAEGIIVNDDANLAITPNTISQQEGDSGKVLYTFTVNRTGLISGSSTAQWSVAGIGDHPANADDFGGSLPTGTITFTAGETSKVITIEVNGDIIAENDEKFMVILGDSAGSSITTASAEGVIVNDDTNLGIVAINADQVEGNSGSKSFTFAIQRTGVLSGTSSTSWAAARSGITPADASDFAAGILPSGTVTFAPGETSKLISIDINGDTQIETDETFSMTLYDNSDLAPQNPTATGTIISDEPITISLGLQPGSTAEDGGQVFSYTFTRNGPTDAPLSINFLISGSADPTNDYTSDRDLSSFPFGSITFNPGDSIAMLEIRPTADTTIENNETIEIELLTSSEYAVGTVGPVVATIINSDQSQAALTISATDATKAEGNSGKTAYTFSVKRSGDTSGSSTAQWAVSSTQATGNDFIGGALPSGTVSFAAGDTSKTITVEVNGDSSIETDESFTVTLANPTGATIITASTSGTIIDDDIATTAIKPISYDMLNGETGSYNYWDESYTGIGNRFQDLSPLSGGLGDLTDGVIASQNWYVTEAPAGPGPYVAWLNVNPSITFNFGKNVDIDRVIVHVDDTSSNNSSVVMPPQSIRLSMAGNTFNSGQINDPPGAQPLAYVFSGLNFHGDSLKLDLVRRTWWVHVSEVEFFGRESGPPLPTLAIVAANADQSEGDAGAKAFTFTVTRTGDTSSPSSAAWAVTGSGSNPASGADFSGAGLPSGIVYFAAGETSQTISVNVNGDSSVESDESFIVTISNPTGARISNANASGSISNDDFPAISLAVAPASVTEDGTSNLVYTFTRTGPTTSALTVNYTVSGTASLGGDYSGIASTPTTKTVNFAAGSATATVTVNPTADTEIEADETVALTLAAGAGYTIGTSSAVTGTISNDDPTITLAVSPATVAEDGTSNLIYTFTRTGSTTSALTVNYTVAGTASFGGDYSGIATTPTTKTVSFTAGSATATVTVDPTADTSIEADETVALTLAAGTNYFIGTTNAVVGTITNDDFPSITLTLAPASVSEDGTSNLVYTFTRTGPITSALTVNYTVSGTATLGSDYGGIATTPTTKTVSFAAGSATATVTVDPSMDTAYEEDESVALTLAAGTGYTIGTTTAVVGTITNDDLPAITLAVSPATVAEDGSSNLIYTFSRTGPTTSALTVNYTVAGTASLGSDYSGIATTPTTKTVSFAAGSATATVTVDPSADTEIEADETVALTLAAGTDYIIGTTNAVVSTITNDDFPAITLAVAPASVTEDGTSNLVYTFSRTGPTTSALTVNYTVAGTASLGSDYSGIATTPTTKTVSFAAGSATATVTVDPSADTAYEEDETVALTLAAGTGYTIGTTTAVVATIINDDAPPVLDIIATDATKAEGNSGRTTYTFTVNRSGDTSGSSTAQWAVSSSQATDDDFSADRNLLFESTSNPDAWQVATRISGVDGSLSFFPASGFARATSVIGRKSDGIGWIANNNSGTNGTWTQFVFRQSFDLSGFDPLTAKLGFKWAADDSGAGHSSQGSWKPKYRINNGPLISGNWPTSNTYSLGLDTLVSGGFVSGRNAIDFYVQGNGGSDGFALKSLGLTASILRGHEGLPQGSITFAPGETSRTITIYVDGDSNIEADESFIVTLANPADATIATASASGTISNDDPTITLTLAPASVTEDGTSNLIYTFTRTGSTTSALTVNYTISGTASLGGDYSGIATTPTTKSVSFAAGSATATVTVDPTADTEIEADETVAFTLAAGTDYFIGTANAVVGTITNDDFPAITLAVAPASVTEDGTSNLVYTFTRTGPTTSALTVNYTVAGTASLGGDYSGIATTPTTKTVSFAAGSATATVTVNPTSDTASEEDETIALTLASGIGYTIGTTNAVVGTITNDDPQVSVTAIANGNEANGSPTVFRFSRTGSTTAPLSVSYRLLGTAQAGSDYSGATTGTISFSAGSANAELSLPALADSVIDPGETIIAQIVPSPTATPSYFITAGQQTATATITAEGMVVTVNGSSRLGASKGEVRNPYAFAALKSDGTVVSWGRPSYGGTTPAGLGGVTQIFSNLGAFAALKSDGTVVSWGDSSLGGTTPAGLGVVTQIFSTGYAFAALKSDGTVVCWGDTSYGGTTPAGLGGVTQIFSNNLAFAALKSDGTVVSWGDTSYGGTTPAGLGGVTQIFSNNLAFSALKGDGAVVCWGDAGSGGTAPAGLGGVTQIFSNYSAFAALKSDGTVVCWGDTSYGGTTPVELSGVTQIFSTGYAFAALKSDGTVVCWGNTSYGGTTPAGLGGVTQIFSTREAFAALKSDGTVVCWGDASHGGTTPAGLDYVTQIFSNYFAFAALKSDGTVVCWGDAKTPAGLSDVVGFANPFTDDRLLPTITLAVSPASISEDGNGNLIYTFTRTGGLTNALTVNYTVAGSGTIGTDYTGVPSTGTTKSVTFAAGAATATLTIDPIADASIEADETVSLTLSAGVGYIVGTMTAVVGTIINDDFPIISLAISPAAVAEDGTTNLVYTFSRTGSTTSALTVNYDITGTSDASDYTGAMSGVGKTITFGVGSTTATLTINPTADVTLEPDETVVLTLANGTGYTIGTTMAVSGTIIDDDFPAISLSVNPDTVLEDETSNLIYSFYRTGQTSAPLTVYYTVGGTASIDDYSAVPSIWEITFAAGQTSVDLVVNPTADNLAEADETVAITLLANSAYKVVTSTSILGTIINDETSLAISPKFTRKTEGNVGSTIFTYTVTRTGALGESSSVAWSTLGVGGQPANAADFAGGLLPSGTVNFAAGEISKNIIILVSGDTLVEPNEAFNIVLSNPRGATIGYGGAPAGNLPITSSSNLIIGLGGNMGFGENLLSANDDRSTGAIDLTSVFPFGLNFFGSTYNSIYLNNNGSITFDSPLSAYTPSPITQLTAYPIIAPFYADVDTRAGTLVASPGGTSKGSNLVYWDLDPVNRQATFTWDDVGKYSWGTSPNAFQLVLKDAGLGNLQIDFRYENINWLVGDASGGTLARAGYSLGDGYTYYEMPQSGTTQMGNLELTSNIGQPGLYRFTLPVVNLPSIARGAIVNDDTSVSISPSSLAYSEGASPTYAYTITRSGEVSLQSSVAWQVHGQWGIDRSDFLGSIIPSGTVVFAPGETTKTIQIKAQDDLAVESNETFVVRLHSAINTGIALNNATGTILNNDFPRRTGGDIHVVTYDGLAYPFQNSGIYTLTKSTSDDLHLAFFLDWVDEDKSVSFATEVALKVENHSFHLKATWDDSFEIDYKGNTQILANSESIAIDDIKIRRIDKSLIFTNSKNEEIHVIDQGSYFDFSYSISPFRMGYMQGLMGNYDGNESNDNQPSWLSSAVQISNSPFAAFIGQDDYRPSFQLPPITRRYEDIPQSVIDYVTSVLLARGITDEILILQAAYDAWVTGDNTYLDDATDFNDSLNLVSPPPPPCFMSGTLIDTPSGEVPIETLRPGDMVLTPAGPQAVKFLGKTTRKASALKPQAKMPIRINKGSLGNNLPIRDTYCTPSHAFVVDDCLVEARALVNNESITNIEKWPDIVPIIYFSIELEDHQLVWANGLLTETYYSNWASTGFSREAWDNYSTYLELYQESKPMNELPMSRIPFARQLPLRIRERFKLGSSSGASREELCLTL